jgi:hypothetical protein
MSYTVHKYTVKNQDVDSSRWYRIPLDDEVVEPIEPVTRYDDRGREIVYQDNWLTILD